MTIPKCPFRNQELSPCDNYGPVTIFWPCPEVVIISDKYCNIITHPGWGESGEYVDMGSMLRKSNLCPEPVHVQSMLFVQGVLHLDSIDEWIKRRCSTLEVLSSNPRVCGSIPIWVNITFNINSLIYDRRLRESKLIFCLSFRLDSLVVIRVKTGASTASTTEGENVQVA